MGDCLPFTSVGFLLQGAIFLFILFPDNPLSGVAAKMPPPKWDIPGEFPTMTPSLPPDCMISLWCDVYMVTSLIIIHDLQTTRARYEYYYEPKLSNRIHY